MTNVTFFKNFTCFVLIFYFCTYLFCCFACGTKATGGATYISPLLTKSQNKYKCRRTLRGNSTGTTTTTAGKHTIAHVQHVKKGAFVTGRFLIFYNIDRLCACSRQNSTKKFSMEATQVTLLLLVVGHWYSVVGLVSRGLLVMGCWSLVMVTIGCNSISMQLYERPKTAINLY